MNPQVLAITDRITAAGITAEAAQSVAEGFNEPVEVAARFARFNRVQEALKGHGASKPVALVVARNLFYDLGVESEIDQAQHI